MESNDKNLFDEIDRNAQEIAPALKDFFNELRREGVDMALINANNPEIHNIVERLYKVREFLIELPEDLQKRIEEIAKEEVEIDKMDRKIMANELAMEKESKSLYRGITLLLVFLIMAGGVGGFYVFKKGKSREYELKKNIAELKHRLKEQQLHIQIELQAECAQQKEKIGRALKECRAIKNPQMPRKIKK